MSRHLAKRSLREGPGHPAQFRSDTKCPVGISTKRGLFEHDAPAPPAGDQQKRKRPA